MKDDCLRPQRNEALCLFEQKSESFWVEDQDEKRTIHFLECQVCRRVKVMGGEVFPIRNALIESEKQMHKWNEIFRRYCK